MSVELTRSDLVRILCIKHFEPNERVNVFSDVTLEFSKLATVCYCGCIIGIHDTVYVNYPDIRGIYGMDKTRVKHR